MERKSLHDIYLDLIPNLVNDLIFFIPRNEVSRRILHRLKSFKDSDFLGRVVLFDEYNGPVPYNKQTNYKGVLKQAPNLDKNLFYLLQLKPQVGNDAFYFLVEKYVNLVRYILKYTQWMSENTKEIPESDEVLKGHFISQSKIFKFHLESIKHKLLKNKNNLNQKVELDLDNALNNVINDLKKALSKSPFKSSTNENESSMLPLKEDFHEKTVVEGVKTKENILIDEFEATKVLLKTYFGIN